MAPSLQGTAFFRVAEVGENICCELVRWRSDHSGSDVLDVRESRKMSGGLPREKRTVRGVGGEICLSGTEDPIYCLSISTLLFEMFYHSCTEYLLDPNERD